MRDNDWLNGVMEIDHPVRVNEDGSVTGHGIQVYAPETYVETTYDGSVLKEHEDNWTQRMQSQGWEPERGWTGQYGYHGPFMHPSEYIGGSLAGHILDTPGVWVAVVVECLRGDPGPDDILECVYCGGALGESDTGLWEDPKAGGPSSDAACYCDESADHLHAPEFDGDDGEPAGWAVLHLDDGPGTESYVITTRHGAITPAFPLGSARVTLPQAREIARLALHLDTRIVRVTDLAVMPAEERVWFRAGTDEPGDKQRDLDVPRSDPAQAGYWGLIGPDQDGYGWTVINGETSETVASGHRDDEDEAKAAVAAWELRQAALLITT